MVVEEFGVLEGAEEGDEGADTGVKESGGGVEAGGDGLGYCWLEGGRVVVDGVEEVEGVVEDDEGGCSD